MKPAVYIGNLKNPQNRGTCIRTGESFGVNLIFTKDKHTKYKYSQGTSNHVTFMRFNTDVEVVEYCKKNHHKIVVIEDTPEALPIEHVNYPANPLFVTGNERDGVSKELLKASRIVVKIPQADTYCRCLNTSVACSIVMQDWFQKNKKKQIQTKKDNAKFGEVSEDAPKKRGCGIWIRESEDYGWVNCGDILSENEDNGKVELCKKCKVLAIPAPSEEQSVPDGVEK